MGTLTIEEAPQGGPTPGFYWGFIALLADWLNHGLVTGLSPVPGGWTDTVWLKAPAL